MTTKRSKSSEMYFNRYKSAKVAETNRKKKLERQLKLQPGNKAQIELAIKNIRYRRHTPKTPAWSSSTRATAVLMKGFVGLYNKNVFSTDPDTLAAALKGRNENTFNQYKPEVYKYKSMFCLAGRAHDGRGNLVWAH